MMDRVGGYDAYLALEEDARRFDLVVLYMQAEHEARLITKND